jgi:hypothetical protein
MAHRVRAEEHSSSEDPLESCDQPLVFLASFVHSESFEHFRRTSEPNHLTLLLYCQGCEKDRDDPVSAERDTVLRVSGDLENKVPVPAFLDELPFWQLPDRETAQYERPGAKAQVLLALFAIAANQRDTFDIS